MAFQPPTSNNTWVTKFGQSTHDDYKSAAANLSKAEVDLKDTDDRITVLGNQMAAMKKAMNDAIKQKEKQENDVASCKTIMGLVTQTWLQVYNIHLHKYK